MDYYLAQACDVLATCLGFVWYCVCFVTGGMLIVNIPSHGCVDMRGLFAHLVTSGVAPTYIQHVTGHQDSCAHCPAILRQASCCVHGVRSCVTTGVVVVGLCPMCLLCRWMCRVSCASTVCSWLCLRIASPYGHGFLAVISI